MNIAPTAIAQYVSPAQLTPLQDAAEVSAALSQQGPVKPTQRVEFTKDRAYFSQEAQDLLAAEEGQQQAEKSTTSTNQSASPVLEDEANQATAPQEGDAEAATEDTESSGNRAADDAAQDPNQLTEQEAQIVDQLQERDREVRQHEQAHLAAAGGLAQGGIQYQFQRGPDGRSYAVGGSVRIDTAPVPGDPAATVRKMSQVRRAALAPLEPSTTDRAVAQQASVTAAQARQELAANGGRSAAEAARAEEAEAQAAAQDAAQDEGSQESPAAAQQATAPARPEPINSPPEPLAMSRLYQGLFG